LTFFFLFPNLLSLILARSSTTLYPDLPGSRFA
jgi:hypothetical protein